MWCFIDTPCVTSVRCVRSNDHIKCVVSLIQFTRCSDSYQTNRPMALLLLTNEVHRAYKMAATLERIKGERTCDADDKVVTKHIPDVFDEVCGVAEAILWHLPLTAVGRSICDTGTQLCHGILCDTGTQLCHGILCDTGTQLCHATLCDTGTQLCHGTLCDTGTQLCHATLCDTGKQQFWAHNNVVAHYVTRAHNYVTAHYVTRAHNYVTAHYVTRAHNYVTAHYMTWPHNYVMAYDIYDTGTQLWHGHTIMHGTLCDTITQQCQCILCDTGTQLCHATLCDTGTQQYHNTVYDTGTQHNVMARLVYIIF